MHAHRADRQRSQDGQQAARVAAFEVVARMAIEAEARALQHHAEHRAQSEREGQRAAAAAFAEQVHAGGDQQQHDDSSGQARARKRRRRRVD
ncbi:hypothetical protein D9M72_612420 [compost metagenome]